MAQFTTEAGKHLTIQSNRRRFAVRLNSGVERPLSSASTGGSWPKTPVELPDNAPRSSSAEIPGQRPLNANPPSHNDSQQNKRLGPPQPTRPSAPNLSSTHSESPAASASSRPICAALNGAASTAEVDGGDPAQIAAWPMGAHSGHPPRRP